VQGQLVLFGVDRDGALAQLGGRARRMMRIAISLCGGWRRRILKLMEAAIRVFRRAGEGGEMGLLSTLSRAAEATAILGSEKSFVANSVIGDPALNARGLHRWRVRRAAELADWRRRRLAKRIAPEDAAAFDRDGFVMKEDYLDPETFAAVGERPFSARPARRARCARDRRSRA
jgi:hypothetical protein